jgi:hypothetical protein
LAGNAWRWLAQTCTDLGGSCSAAALCSGRACGGWLEVAIVGIVAIASFTGDPASGGNAGNV